MTSVPQGATMEKQTGVSVPVLLGFGRLEDFAEACSTALPIAFADLYETAPASNTMSASRKYVIVEQYDPAQSIIRYCRVCVGSIALYAYEPVPGQQDKMQAMETFAPLVRQHLLDAGYTLVNATYAIPKDLTLLEGESGFIAFDSEANSFRLISEMETGQ